MATTKTKEAETKPDRKSSPPVAKSPAPAETPKRSNRKPKPKPSAPHAYGPPVVVEVMVKVQALAFEEADGGYSVAVPELPGCFTMGDTIEEVRAMVKDAAEGWLASQHDRRREQAIRDVTEPLPSEAAR